MIAVDTSVILAMALGEPEAERFTSLVGREALAIGWPTLLEARMVLTGRGFSNASDIVDQFVRLPNVTTIAFDEKHYREAERAFDCFGKGRHPATLNMGDCFSYAVAAVAR
ncbi:type II toxin-antitoxin system VapC family toxin, partial [Rhizobium sp. ICMP 5592]|uniref:type II toxin-antitoxin system VapC family toxin n=1 Tax=Rhizobium sp. ICMP 5592 TaxID=2292445 RepID=UPI001296B0C1